MLRGQVTAYVAVTFIMIQGVGFATFAGGVVDGGEPPDGYHNLTENVMGEYEKNSTTTAMNMTGEYLIRPPVAAGERAAIAGWEIGSDNQWVPAVIAKTAPLAITFTELGIGLVYWGRQATQQQG